MSAASHALLLAIHAGVGVSLQALCNALLESFGWEERAPSAFFMTGMPFKASLRVSLWLVYFCQATLDQGGLFERGQFTFRVLSLFIQQDGVFSELSNKKPAMPRTAIKTQNLRPGSQFMYVPMICVVHAFGVLSHWDFCVLVGHAECTDVLVQLHV
jgi:hypothetical protein